MRLLESTRRVFKAVRTRLSRVRGGDARTLAPHMELGRRGEALAAEHLRAHGYKLVASNFKLAVGRNRRGAVVQAEIDLVAYEGPLVCFVEVKTRASDWYAAP